MTDANEWIVIFGDGTQAVFATRQEAHAAALAYEGFALIRPAPQGDDK